VLHAGLRIVSVPRMLLDLASTGWPIGRLAHEAAASGLVSLDDLRASAAKASGRPGVAALRAALDLPHTRSRGEIRLAAFLRRLAVGEFEMNAQVGRLQVDALIPSLGLAIELDPEQTHGTTWARQTDAWRDRYLRGRGLEPLRVELDDLGALGAELRARVDKRVRERPACRGSVTGT
jgi:very-short-patch-repair endonuclease